MLTVQEIEEKIESEKARWAEQEKEILRQYDRLFGLHNGRVSVYQEMLDAARGEGESTQTDATPEITVDDNDIVLAE